MTTNTIVTNTNDNNIEMQKRSRCKRTVIYVCWESTSCGAKPVCDFYEGDGCVCDFRDSRNMCTNEDAMESARETMK